MTGKHRAPKNAPLIEVPTSYEIWASFGVLVFVILILFGLSALWG